MPRLGTLLCALLCISLPPWPTFAAEPPGAAAASLPAPPLAPADALKSFRLEPGLRLDLVAAEPTVVDPVALAFDESGRMYVVENRGYPTGPGEGKPPAGMVALLEDRDGDGQFETRTDFASGLTFPNGVMPWKGGLFVTCAPDVLYLKDTDGDGRADVRQVALTGFDASNTTQLRVSHPTLALDNWIYLTSGLTGGKVTSPSHPERSAIEVRTDSRFRPDTLEFEPLEGRAQFGLAFDEFGRRFICMNRVQAQHVVLPARYLRRNPHLAFSETVQNCPEQMLAEPLKGHGAAARIYPISENVTTADSHAGTFTAACAVWIYRGDGLPSEYRGGAFSCDPTGNLVHFDQLVSSGATFLARRARDGSEFLASTDNWFRPVFLTEGPDGGLYVCDMYRKTIEHPQYLPEEIRKRTDFDSGKGLGRIYRVRSSHAAAKASRPLPHQLSAEELCRELNSANGWRAETARRLLVEQKPERAIPGLRSLLTNGLPVHAAGRTRALWILEAMAALDETSLRLALRDPVPGVRENALRLLEPRLKADTRAAWWELLQTLADDSDSRVRFQCALALGAISSPDLVPLLRRIALREPADRWTRVAVLSSLRDQAEAMAGDVLAQRDLNDERSAAFLEDLGRLCGASPVNHAGILRQALVAAPVRLSFLAGFADGLRDGGRSARDGGVLIGLLEDSTPDAEQLRARWDRLCDTAGAVALDGTGSMAQRLAATKLLGDAPGQVGIQALGELIGPQQPVELQVAAVRALLQRSSADTLKALLEKPRWQNYTPAVREALLSGLLANPRHLSALMDAFQSGRLPLGALDSGRRNQLLKHRDEAIRKRAEAVFREAQSGDRMAVYEDFKGVLKLPSDPKNGRVVFRQHCAPCHRLDREGVPVGPDLFGIRNQPKEAILLHILLPEYEIVPGFTGYIVETKDGRTLSGLIASETESSVTVRGALGQEETVLRSNVASISATALSLMPQEMEKNMSRQELADLVAYLKGE